MKLPAFAGATAPFAHLLGLAKPAAVPPATPAAAKPSAEDKKDDRRDGESDDDYAKRKAAEKDEKEEAERAAAEGASEEDDDEEEMKGKSPIAEARRRERRRVAAILGSPHAAGRVHIAAALACLTAMTRKEALAVLETMPAAEAEKPASRVAADRQNPRLGPGGDVGAGPQAVAQSWDSAFKKATPRK